MEADLGLYMSEAIYLHGAVHMRSSHYVWLQHKCRHVRPIPVLLASVARILTVATGVVLAHVVTMVMESDV